MKTIQSLHMQKFFLVFLILVCFGASCVPSGLIPASTPVLQTVEVTREVTRDVIIEVTREVTQIVEIPVTVTPTITPDISLTPSLTPTQTLLPGPAIVRTQAAVSCLYGPSTVYLNKYALVASVQLEAVGRSLDGEWANVQTMDHKNPCWLKAISVTLESGTIAGLPVVDPVLTPYSEKYSTPLQAVSVNRVDDEVTIFWLPVSIPEVDYRGYLIEAWVCQGGQPVFIAKTHVPAYADNQNNKMQYLLVVDEPGCTAPSHARISLVVPTGYSRPKEMAWPDPNFIPTPTVKP